MRRVLEGEQVPSREKIVSIFEPHTDIVVKDNRETRYGHKVCLTGGKSSLVLDCVIEEGNPADATLVERTLTRHIALFGQAPPPGGLRWRLRLQGQRAHRQGARRGGHRLPP